MENDQLACDVVPYHHDAGRHYFDEKIGIAGASGEMRAGRHYRICKQKADKRTNEKESHWPPALAAASLVGTVKYNEER